jgi:creatinine amidohydrolase/Fe(II)-dependent formamide hydrolase-like protein
MNMNLFHGETRTAWHRFGTQDFPELAESKPLCILPIGALKESECGEPLDQEERTCGEYLKRATDASGDEVPFLVLPPIRQVPLQEKGQVFTIDMESASKLVEATVTSAVRSGFTRFCLLHAGESLTDWLDGVGRDLRVGTGARIYRVGLHALGLCDGGVPSESQVSSFAELLAAISSHGETS